MKNPQQSNQAFSLVEMLSVIAVIGIVSAIAIPNIGRINESASEAKNKRNAQNLASICQAAQAAGLDFVEGGAGTTIQNVIAGGTVSGGVFDGSYFGLPGLTTFDINGASEYLFVENGVLVYLNPGAAEDDDDAISDPGSDDADIPVVPETVTDIDPPEAADEPGYAPGS